MTKQDIIWCKNILKQHLISITNNRVQVLQFLLNQTQAVTKSAIEEYFNAINTVTIYRMLYTFLNHGIIHAISNKNGEILYALCKENCTPQKHVHNHVHFSCKKCQKTFCLDDILIPSIIPLKKGYSIDDIDIHITGICDTCSSRKNKHNKQRIF